MRSWIAAAAVALACGSFVAKGAEPADTEKLLVGNWSCVDGACPDEEIAFAIEDGERSYSSWLHHRPSVIGSTWKLDGKRVTVTREGSVSYDWRIVKLDAKRLVLREVEGADELLLKRIVEKKKTPPKK